MQKIKSVIGFRIGGRNIENLKAIIDKVFLLHSKRIYTDKLKIYFLG